MNDKEHEDEFVAYIKNIGIDEKLCMAEGVNNYYRFILKNGEYRYWTNLSMEHQKELDFID